MDADAEQNELNVIDLVPKKKAKSIVWTWFGFEPNDSEQINIICKLCRDIIRSPDGNTTNLFHHLRKKHPKEHADSQSKKPQIDQPQASTSKLSQPTLMQSFAKATAYEKSSKRWGEITDAVTYYLAKDMIPMKAVENAGFQRLMKVADSRYQLPGRKYFSNTAIPRLYSECRSKLKNKLDHVKFFATTSDLWSSRTSEPYLSLSVHYISDWKLCSATLQATYFLMITQVKLLHKDSETFYKAGDCKKRI